MSNKIKNIVTTCLFSAFIAVFVVMCVIRAFNPVDYSDVEKRPLAQFPEISRRLSVWIWLVPPSRGQSQTRIMLP